jgi:CysZ protein
MLAIGLTRTTRSLWSPHTLKAALICAAVTALLLALWMTGMVSLLHSTTVVSTGWLDTVLDWLFGGMSAVAAWFLFPMIMPLIASQLIDGTIARIARDEYQTQVHEVPLMHELGQGVRFLVLGVLLNLVLMPLYFIPLLGQALYLCVNGYLLAGEFWEMACDRLGVQPQSLQRRRMRLTVAGVVIVAGANIPLLNLLTPLTAAILSVHLVMQAKERDLIRLA